MRLNVFLAALMLFVPAAQAAGVTPTPTPTSCGPADSGAPCGGDGPASQGNTSGTNQGAGNPINLITGNKYQVETDLPALPGVLGLEIVRHYNSVYADPRSSNGVLDRGWRLSYETNLNPIGNTLQIMQADGTRIIFIRNRNNPNLCATNNPANGTVAIQKTPRGDEYRWTWSNGRILSFNHQGKLTQIKAPTGEFSSLTRDLAGVLVKVTDPQGRSLVLGYPGKRDPSRFNGVTHIESPVGRFSYAYGSAVPKAYTGNPRDLLANLTRVDLPSKTSRHFHYEDSNHATLLTGISVAGQGSKPQRISTWAYDIQGRGILSVKGLPRMLGKDGQPIPGTGIEQVNLNFDTPGKTRLTNSLGQTTTYQHAIVGNEHRLLEARGPGCASCGEANVRYGYDRLGRLTEETRLSPGGQPLATTKTERDAQGRVVGVSAVVYANGKARPARPLVRYEYAGQSPQPSLIARPSVIPGREAVTRIGYNASGQPTQVTEIGFSPLDDKGQTSATPISRTTTYAYQAVNGRSLLAQIDGPLANGKTNSPADSDITRYEWDGRGDKPARIVYPMNRSLALAYGDGGRVKSVARQFERVVQRTLFQTTPHSQVVKRTEQMLSPDHRTVLAERITTSSYDARNQLTQIVWPDQSRTEIGRDPAGHTQPVTLADGRVLSFNNPAPEPQLVEASGAAQSPSQTSALKASWGASGTAAQNQVLQFEAHGKTARRLIDDFGRVVAIKNSDQAWQTALYDAADRLIQITDPRGARTLARFDLADRLVEAQRFAPGRTQPEETIRLAWAGPNKTEETVHSGGQLTHRSLNRYTAWGQLAHQAVHIQATHAKADGQVVRLQQTLRYGETGKLLSRTLPDGTRLAYRYYASPPAQAQAGGQLAAIEQIRWSAWLDALMVRLPEAWQRKTVLARFDAPAPPEMPADSGPRPAAANLIAGQNAPSLTIEPGPAIEPGLTAHAPGQQFDPAGLPHRLATAQGEFELTWNAAARLSEVRDTQGRLVAAYRYDAQGRRASKTTPAGSEFYLYEGTQLIAVASQDAQGRTRISGQYAYHGYRPVAWFRSKPAANLWQKTLAWLGWNRTPAYALTTDHRGAVLAVTTLETDPGQRKTVWQSHIDAWGAVPANAADKLDPKLDPKLRLVNQYADQETGLSYNLARYYDPRAGRYISPDPAGIADSIDDQTPDQLKLDLTAYVSGQPMLYFDPDGAAKIRYYAITTGADGKALGTTQGFTNARWAFVIYDIQGGGATNAELGKLRNQYAATRTGLLFDGKGNFIGSAADPLTGITNPTKTAIKQEGGINALSQAFVDRYAGNIIGIPQFDVEFDDDQATKLIWYLMTDPAKRTQECKTQAPGWLPEIRFAAEEVPIKVTTANYPNPANTNQSLAQSQRIVACGQAAANDVVERRINKYNYAAMLLESVPSQINSDCSGSGCPGRALNGTALQGYSASYGRTQFIVSTMMGTLQQMRNDTTLTDQATRLLLRLDDAAIWDAPGPNVASVFGTALLRAQYITGIFNSRNAGSLDWARSPQPDRTAFMTGTGLNATRAEGVWNDINRWKRNPTANLNNEARQAFISTVVLADPVMNNWLMPIFMDNGGAFNVVSKYLIRENYNDIVGRVNQTNANPLTLHNGSINPAWQARQREIEIELAARTARLHNGDPRGHARNSALRTMMNWDATNAGRQYATRFLNAFEWPVVQPADPRRQQPTGDYFSLRCTSTLPALAPRDGLQLAPLVLN